LEKENPVGFYRELLSRVDTLSRHYYNGGNHIPFPFQTQKEKDAIYSIMRQYRREE
jgi:hypothetical protein